MQAFGVSRRSSTRPEMQENPGPAGPGFLVGFLVGQLAGT